MFTSLYIHVPFCRAKCGYCAFYSTVGGDENVRCAYLGRLATEFAESANHCAPLDSVFIGGGTPNILSAAELNMLLGSVSRHFTLAADCEFSMECNPEEVTREKCRTMIGGGVNRVSVGVQSFNPALRQVLGRRGNPDTVRRAIAMLHEAGFDNLGVDLIYGIPGQTADAWQADLDRLAPLGISHLSAYALTIEEGSRLASSGIDPVDDDCTAQMWEMTDECVAPMGLRRYEISNFARPGRECRHNLRIWHGGTYLGCGPAASSFDGRRRWTQAADLEAWLRRAQAEYDDLPPARRAAEILAFGMRTAAGWNLADFKARTGHDAEALRGPQIARLADLGLLEKRGQTIRPTRRGLLFADTIATELL